MDILTAKRILNMSNRIKTKFWIKSHEGKTRICSFQGADSPQVRIAPKTFSKLVTC